MNALWPKATHQALGGETKDASPNAASAKDSSVASLDAMSVRVPEAVKPPASKDDEQALQLLQGNRKLEAQVKVWHRSEAMCLNRCDHFSHVLF
jgi:hypothetical protein